MTLSELYATTEPELNSTLQASGPETVGVSASSSLTVQQAVAGGYVGELRVGELPVVRISGDDLDTFRQRLRERIAQHVPRDERPDLTEL